MLAGSLKLNFFLTDSNAASAMGEDSSAYFNTLIELREMSFTLEHEHRTHQRMLARETKYGSK